MGDPLNEVLERVRARAASKSPPTSVSVAARAAQARFEATNPGAVDRDWMIEAAAEVFAPFSALYDTPEELLVILVAEVRAIHVPRRLSGRELLAFISDTLDLACSMDEHLARSSDPAETAFTIVKTSIMPVLAVLIREASRRK